MAGKHGQQNTILNTGEKMKNKHRQVFILLFMLAACQPQKESNYFSGTIAYDYSYTSDSLNIDSLTRSRPSKGLFRYDINDYQSEFTGSESNTYYYSGKLNKCIAENSLQKKLECEDYGVASDSILSYKLYDTDEKILGYSCRVIELQKSRSWVKYYFSKDLIMSPATYQNHKAFNWDGYGTQAGGGLILKLEHRFKLFTMKGVATRIEVKKNNFRALEIEDSLFTRVCK